MTRYSFMADNNNGTFVNVVNAITKAECFSEMMKFATNYMEVEHCDTVNETYSLTFKGKDKITIKSKHNKCVITMLENED